MRIGDEITVAPTELVAGGEALARVDGFPIFVASVYPGDVARVRLAEVKKGFARAELVRIERLSPLRRVAPCPIAEECGGCDWTSLRLDAQLTAKRRVLTESLRRVGKIDPATLPPILVHPSPLNYRLRSRLHEENGAVGFYAMRSNRVVPLAVECEVVGPLTRRFAPPSPRVAGRGDSEVEIWEIDGRLVEGELTINVGDYRYTLSTDTFFQVNRHLLETMLRRVTEIASHATEKQTAIDLYAGVGFFTAPLTRLFDHVIAVEGATTAARYLRMNASAECVNAPVEQWATRMPEADFVFLDPPRAGARREVIDAVGRRAKHLICYLSCDPVTFARDANRLIAAGWRLATLDLLDLFPNTHHVETLSSFERVA